MRDAGLFQSALARPENLAAYGRPDVAACAAAYGFGIALNDQDLLADYTECVTTMLALAAGELDEAAFTAWLRTRIAPRA